MMLLMRSLPYANYSRQRFGLSNAPCSSFPSASISLSASSALLAPDLLASLASELLPLSEESPRVKLVPLLYQLHDTKKFMFCQASPPSLLFERLDFAVLTIRHSNYFILTLVAFEEAHSLEDH